MRTIIELPPVQLDALDALCRRENISRAEAIRQAVAAHVGRASAAARGSAFGLWRDRGINALAYERGLRAEWEPTARAPRSRGRSKPAR
ncbi:MAG TPA: CopG family transcriptional regulator [Vicinamibacterales bacterium]|nr:CopG family transcriptional regulator [Vicinamibacterales bacterium]